jgi:uncharacterized membrane protein required for colicin V production
MQIDIAIIIIILIFAFLGFKNGLVRTLFHTFGWIIAIVTSFLLRKQVETFLMDHTQIYDRYLAYVEGIFRSFSDKHAGNLADSIPGVVGDALESVGDKLVDEAAASFVDTTFTIFTFIGFALLIKFVFFIITLLLSKRHHGGFVGGLDGIAGLLMGMVQGLVIVLILLALLLPVSLALNPEYYNAINSMLDRAVFADILCNNNPLFHFMKDYLPDNLIPSEWLNEKSGSFDALNPDSLV